MHTTATPLTREELNELRAQRDLPPYNYALIYQPRPLAGPDWDPEQLKKSRGRADARKKAKHRARWQPKAALRSSSRKRGAP